MIEGKTLLINAKIQFLLTQIKTKQLIFKQLRCFIIVNLCKIPYLKNTQRHFTNKIEYNKVHYRQF